MSLKAAIFLRRNGANGYGHAGWCFSLGNGSSCFGAVENFGGGPWAPSDRKDQWMTIKNDRYVLPHFVAYDYDEYKVMNGSGNWRAALQMIDEWYRKDYILIGQNCMNATFYVLQAFGCTMASPNSNLTPNSWYDHTRGTDLRVRNSANLWGAYATQLENLPSENISPTAGLEKLVSPLEQTHTAPQL